MYDTVRGDPIVRGGGQVDYYTISEEARFRMRRPVTPSAEPGA